MTLRSLKRAMTAGFASTSMTAALMLGVGAGTAHADVLDDLAGQYAHGAGTGPIANLLTQSIKLRQMGYKPTQASYDGINKALTYKPNQTPLIKALQDTIDQQNHLMQETKAVQGAGGGNNPINIGINQYNPSQPGGVSIGPGGVGLGGGPVQIGGQPGTTVGPPGG